MLSFCCHHSCAARHVLQQGDLAEKLAGDSEYLGKLTEVEQFEIKDAEIHDVIFPNIDLNWWKP